VKRTGSTVAKITKVGILVNQNKPDALRVLGDVKRWFSRHRIAAVDDTTLTRKEVVTGSDLVLVLGGDGTLLNAIRYLGRRRVPLAGVNLGGLGFLTEITRSEIYGVLESIIRGKYRVSERTMLLVSANGAGKGSQSFIALNDVVVMKEALARMVTLKLCINGEVVTSYSCDGLIVSTPTGSTAHSLSAGGPIIHPEVDAMVITPVCPHTLTNRPLIVPTQVSIKILISSDSEVAMTVDGQIGV
jgi:NAD+ kinase